MTKKNLLFRLAKKSRAKLQTKKVARLARLHEYETFERFLNSTVALIRLLRNKWSCLVNPEFRIPRFFWWDLLNCLWWEKLRENWLSNRNNISRERTKSFWGDDLAPWRYPPKPTPKKEKAETTQTIIMNWSLERSVHILHLHLFFPFPARCTKLYWCASGLSFIGIFVRGQSTKKSCGGKSQTRSDKALAVKHLFIWILVLAFLYSRKKEEMKSRLTRCQWSLSGLL